MKSQIDQEEDTCDNPCTCTVLLGKGHHMTRDLQPQRDIDRERERERRSLHPILPIIFHTHRTFLHTDAFAQKLLHTDAFTHRSVYTQTLLHTEAFTHRRFLTQTLDIFTHIGFYTQTPLHTDTRHFYTEKAFTHRRLYTHTDAFIPRCLYTHTLSRTNAFAHRSFYTQRLLHSFYTQKLLHTDTFTHRHFYPQKLLHTHKHTEALQQLRASHQQRTLFWSATSSRQICSHRAKDLSPGMCNSPVVKR